MSEISHAEIARKVEANSDGIEKLRSEMTSVKVAQEEFARSQEKMADTQEKTLEMVEAYAAVKTGGRFVAWFAKFMAGMIALWVFVKGGAQFLVEIGKPPL